MKLKVMVLEMNSCLSSRLLALAIWRRMQKHLEPALGKKVGALLMSLLLLTLQVVSISVHGYSLRTFIVHFGYIGASIHIYMLYVCVLALGFIFILCCMEYIGTRIHIYISMLYVCILVLGFI